jgi:cell wall assembly regulator SMI1
VAVASRFLTQRQLPPPRDAGRSALDKLMQQKYLIFGFILLLLAAGLYSLRSLDLNFELAKALIGKPLPDDVMYPPSPVDMPACNLTPLPELLARYEEILIKLGVPVATCLNQGLNDDQLDQLESRFSVKLSTDIRNLYKWHNGTPEECTIAIFPLGKMLPLDYSLEMKHRPRAGNRAPRVEHFMDEWMAFQKSWIEITADGSGNGYYYDPERIDCTSSFFYHAHDDVPYDFYPCIGNFIESLIDEYERGDIVFENDSVRSTDSSSYDGYVQRINRYGRHVE